MNATILRAAGWFLLGAFVLGSVGCATGPPGTPSASPSDVSGVWSGTITLGVTSKLYCCGGASGPIYLTLSQDGEKLTGSVEGVGFRGVLLGFANGSQVSGSLSYTVGQNAGSSRFDATVSGTEMIAVTVESTLILSRAR